LLIYAERQFERNGSISDADLDLSIMSERPGEDAASYKHPVTARPEYGKRDQERRTIELAFEAPVDDLRRWETAEQCAQIHTKR